MSQKIKLSFGTVSKLDNVIRNNGAVIPDSTSKSIPDNSRVIPDISHVIPDNKVVIPDNDVIPDKMSRNQKRNKYIKEKKATFEFVMEKDELAMLKEHARNRNMTVTAMLKEAVSQYIQNNPV